MTGPLRRPLAAPLAFQSGGARTALGVCDVMCIIITVLVNIIQQDVYGWMISAVEDKKLSIIKATRQDILMLKESVAKEKLLTSTHPAAAAD